MDMAKDLVCTPFSWHVVILVEHVMILVEPVLV